MGKHEGVQLIRCFKVTDLFGDPGEKFREALECSGVPVKGETLKGYPTLRCSKINVILDDDGDEARLECVYTEQSETDKG